MAADPVQKPYAIDEILSGIEATLDTDMVPFFRDIFVNILADLAVRLLAWLVDQGSRWPTWPM